jgi:acid phosphatase
MNRIAAAVLAASLAAPLAAQELLPNTLPCAQGNTLLTGVLWMQKSAEYKAVSMQAYAAARRTVETAMRVKMASKLPAAVILDLDETAILNVDFEVDAVRSGVGYDRAMWEAWTARGEAAAVPGAKEFLTNLPKGVTPFYVTNRKLKEQAGTRKNVENLGYPVVAVADPDDPAADNLLMRGEKAAWEDDKTSRREWVAQRYRVLALIGDDLNDFTSATNLTTAERDAILTSTAAEWGTRWFILPNPLYGSWHKAMLADELRKDPSVKDPNAAAGALRGCQELQLKFDALGKK